MSRSAASRSRARNALGVPLLLGLIGLCVGACGRDAGEIRPEDAKHITARVQLLVDAMPFERLAANLEQGKKMIEDNPGLAGMWPLSKSEVDGILAQWRRNKEALNAGPWWRAEGPLPPEQRAREVARLETMKRSLDAIREFLRPHRAWVEDRFGAELLSASR